MFVGHLAVAFGVRGLNRRLTLPILIAATFLVDLIWPVTLLTGLEVVRVDPGNTAFTPLDFVSYPWTHSLLLAAIWGAAAGLIALRRFGSRAAWIVGGVVVSHWILDWISHGPDLPLYPGGARHGLGLWNSIPGTFLVEGTLLAGGLALYLRAVKLSSPWGRVAFWSLIVLMTGIWLSLPWSPPPSLNAVAATGLTMWLIPAWGIWIERGSPAAGSSRPPVPAGGGA